jgi:hypothetical protein
MNKYLLGSIFDLNFEKINNSFSGIFNTGYRSKGDNSSWNELTESDNDVHHSRGSQKSDDQEETEKEKRGRNEDDEKDRDENVMLIINIFYDKKTKVVRLNHVHGEVYSIQHYVIKFVSNRWVDFLFLGTSVSSTNKTDRHDMTEILLRVPLSTRNYQPV